MPRQFGKSSVRMPLLTLDNILTCPEDATPEDTALYEDTDRLGCLQSFRSWMPAMAEELGDKLENLILCGLRHLSAELLAAALQAASHLGQLNEVVSKLLEDLTDVLAERIHSAFDLAVIGKELGDSHPPKLPRTWVQRPSEVNQEDVHASFSTWNNKVWDKLQALLVDEFPAIMGKVLLFEQVLRCKPSLSADESLLAEVQSKLGCAPSVQLWNSLLTTLETECDEAVKNPDFWQTILVARYPKLARLLEQMTTRLKLLLKENLRFNALASPTLRSFTSHRAEAYMKDLKEHWRQMVRAIGNALKSDGSTADQVTAFVQSMAEELEACADQPSLLHSVSAVASTTWKALLAFLSDYAGTDDTPWSLTNVNTLEPGSARAQVAQTLRDLDFCLSEDAAWSHYQSLPVAQWKTDVEQLSRKLMLDPLASSARTDMLEALAHVHSYHQGLAGMDVTEDDAEFLSEAMEAYMTKWQACEKLVHLYGMDRLNPKTIKSLVTFALSVHVMFLTLLRSPNKVEAKARRTDTEGLVDLLSQSLSRCSTEKAANANVLETCGEPYRLLQDILSHFSHDGEERTELDDSSMASWPPMLHMQSLLCGSMSFPLAYDICKFTPTAYVDWVITTSQAKQEFISDRVQRTVLRDIRQWITSQSSLDEDALTLQDVKIFSQLKSWMERYASYSS